jgi:trans-aconitate methyltransferase
MSDAERIAAYYDRLVDRYGHDPRAVDASSASSLEVRYRVLREVADLSGLDVLEIGCGFGDLGAHLRERYPGMRYRGVDISSRMIEQGRAVHPELDLRRASLDELDEADAADIVVAQGIFYLLDGDAAAKTQRMIGQMFALARNAVAFSAVSAWGRRDESSEFYVDPVALVEVCRELTTSLTLRHDYHPGDVTMYLYRR